MTSRLLMGKSLTFIYSVIQKCGIIPVVFNVVGGHCRVTATRKGGSSKCAVFSYIIFYTWPLSVNSQIESKRSAFIVCCICSSHITGRL